MSHVHIVTTTFNRLEYTKVILNALYELDAGYPWKITIIDNGSTDGTQEWLSQTNCGDKLEKIIILPENKGIPYAHNLAWYLGPKDYYLKLDNDMIVQKDGWLAEMVDCADKIEQGGVFGYNVEPVEFEVHTLNGKRCRPKIEGNLGGACFLIPERTFERLGYWYVFPNRVYGEEDAEYSWRVKHAKLLNIYMEDNDAFVHLPAGKADLPGEDQNYRDFKDRERALNLVPDSEYKRRMFEVANRRNLYVDFKP